MSHDKKGNDGKPTEIKSALMACQSFEDILRRIIRNPNNSTSAHVAAECLFAVRKLGNALKTDNLHHEGH
ncbi:hypothetical protein HAQ01_14025 [Acidithiobacillus thiooxidans]|uniref:hypothetical protein n=1 Tax=Acidithiobacillus TaxID=119977 RepID=UPI001C06593A|nr:MULTISPECIES: hypothetical protein [Acidithiobacillus]MBU2742415.1 hypothetical protein [Acidithiobacillus albertensis]MBU2794474.1 hypothetical protein [Acidithiobacillus thiooxidans]